MLKQIAGRAPNNQAFDTINKKRPTLADLIDKYAKEIRTNKRSWKEDERHAGFFREAFGGWDPAELQPGDIEAWKAKRLEKVAPATVNRSLAYLKHLYNLAIRDGLLDRNPLAQKRVKMMREAPPPDRFLQPEEEVMIEPWVPPWFWRAIQVALKTGMRQGEQFSRGREDVDLRHRRIRLGLAKGGYEWVRLGSDAVEVLREQLSSHKLPWVWPNAKCTAPLSGSAVFHRLDSACKKAGVEGVNWHTLRHTFVSRLVMLNTPITLVKELARHRSLAMTMRYAHLASGHADEALAKLDRAYPIHDLQRPTHGSPRESPPRFQLAAGTQLSDLCRPARKTVTCTGDQAWVGPGLGGGQRLCLKWKQLPVELPATPSASLKRL